VLRALVTLRVVCGAVGIVSCVAGCTFESAALPAGPDAALDAPIVLDARPNMDGDGDGDGRMDSPEATPDASGMTDGPLADIDAPEGQPDARSLPDATLPRPDARPPPRPDARVPDAPPPDAPTGPCPTRATVLELGTPIDGTLSGASHYTPTCGVAASSGPEDFYRLDVSAPAATELVIDLDDKDTLDGVLDVTADCKSASGIGLCSSVGAPGAGEVVVVPRAVDASLYIAVDSIGAQGGVYVLDAFVRTIVGKNVACDPTLIASRCQLGLYCVDKDNDGAARCEQLTPSVAIASGTLAVACQNAVVATDDTAVIGSFASASAMGVVRLEPPRTGHVRAVVDDGLGGCAADTVLEVMSGDTCATAATVVARDDNSGLGPCPRLDAVPVTKDHTVWLRLHLAEGAGLPPGATYSLVIDYD
jgi:hypothetical protein